MIKVFVNDIEVLVNPNSSALEACEVVGIEVPRFCYHERLSLAGNCRMCLVEIAKMPKPAASCTTPIVPDMRIYTDTPLVKKARESVLEFLLLNHPLDCPICDQGGECDLQDQAMVFGNDSTRFYDFKRGVEDKNIGPLIKTIMTRCIHCTRCVRFAAEIAGVETLGTTGRGTETEIGTYFEKTFQSELSGNVIDLCPVGALTSKPFAFTSRPWEINNTESIDLSDAVGSNIRIDFKETEIVRIVPRLNEDINEDWISNKPRFSYDALKRHRLDRPYKKVWHSKETSPEIYTSKLEEMNWESTLQLIHTKLSETPSYNVSVVYGPDIDIEGLSAMTDLFTSLQPSNLKSKGVFDNTIKSYPNGGTGRPNIGTARQIKFNTEFTSNYLFNTTIADIDKIDACLIIGANPRFEASLINTRLRKRSRLGKVEVGVLGAHFDLTYPVTHLGTDINSILSICEGRHTFCSKLKQAKNPLIIIGSSIFEREDAYTLNTALNLLSRTLGIKISILQNQPNQVNALELGINEVDSQFLKASSLIFLLGTQNQVIKTNQYPEPFTVYIGDKDPLSVESANIILPSAAFTEKVGTFYNLEGRPQQTKKALNSLNLARDHWQIGRIISDMNTTKPLCYNSFKSLQDRLKIIVPSYNNLNNIETSNIQLIHLTNEIIYNTTLHTIIKDFYLTDILTNSSQVMAKCSQNARKEWVNFN
jgi:NADH dehydrogenase (ubiquinone) Fe-S protein 1